MPRPMKFQRHVDQESAAHSLYASALRDLEKALRQAGWASIYVDYRSGYLQEHDKNLSPRTNRLFMDSDNTAARRRRLMKPKEKTNDKL